MKQAKTILFYDVETTGLPIWGSPSEHPDQPRVIQIAAELVDSESREIIKAINHIILPNGWIISDEIAELTGITQAEAEASGIEIEIALPQFLDLHAQTNDVRVGHNEPFDARMMRIEMMKAGIYSEEFLAEFKAFNSFDTMTKSAKIVGLPPTEKMMKAGRNTPKSPNLQEAYQFFTGQPLEGAHNASVDVMACKTIYFALEEHNAKQAA